jgi:hypothetical protein
MRSKSRPASPRLIAKKREANAWTFCALPPTPATRLKATGADLGGEGLIGSGRLQVPTLISTGQTFPGAIDAFLPARSSLDLNDDVLAHEVGYGIGKALIK